MIYQDLVIELFNKIEITVKDDPELCHYLTMVRNDYQIQILPVLEKIKSDNQHLIFYKDALELELANNITIDNAENILNIIVATNDKLIT